MLKDHILRVVSCCGTILVSWGVHISADDWFFNLIHGKILTLNHLCMAKLIFPETVMLGLGSLIWSSHLLLCNASIFSAYSYSLGTLVLQCLGPCDENTPGEKTATEVVLNTFLEQITSIKPCYPQGAIVWGNVSWYWTFLILNLSFCSQIWLITYHPVASIYYFYIHVKKSFII